MMPEKIKRVRRASVKRFLNRFPALTYIVRQMIFWILAYAFLATVSHLLLKTAGSLLEAKTNLTANLIIAVYLGFFNGIATGLADMLFEKRLFYNKSLGIIFLGKMVIYLIVF